MRFLVYFIFLIYLPEYPILSLIGMFAYVWCRTIMEKNAFIEEVKKLVDEAYENFSQETAGLTDDLTFDFYLELKQSVIDTLINNENLNQEYRTIAFEIFEEKFRHLTV